jgi:dipeptidase E
MVEGFASLKKINLSEFSGVYIGGGNTFKLLEGIRKIGFDKILADYINKGGNYYGGSAGAIILGKDISSSNDENISEIKRLDGLNLIQNLGIFCHFDFNDEKDKLFVQKISKQKTMSSIALPEDAGLVIQRGKIISSGPAAFYLLHNNDFKKILPGDKVF